MAAGKTISYEKSWHLKKKRKRKGNIYTQGGNFAAKINKTSALKLKT